MAPSPPTGTGLHRYIFLVFKQDDVINAHEIEDLGHQRAKFNTRYTNLKNFYFNFYKMSIFNNF